MLTFQEGIVRMKKHGLIYYLTVGLLFASWCCAETGSAENDIGILKRTGKAFSEVAKKAMPAVVFITVEKEVAVQGYSPFQFNDPFDFFGFDRFRGQPGSPRTQRRVVQGWGSGFIITEDGYILTNNHVVGDSDKITVKLHDGRTLEAELVGTDPRSEVAVIKIDAEELPFLETADSAKLDIGEWVIAIGNPFGLAETLTVGVVSAKGRSNIGLADYEDFIQTDAAINPGNSGGPLLNIDGKVIGINTAIMSQSGGYMGIGFAIPINMALAIRDQLVEKGRVTRGFLGVRLNPQYGDEMAKSFGLDEARGALVAEVMEDTPGAEAGLRSGDIILQINGDELRDSNELMNKVALMRPGTNVTLKIFRDGKEIEKKVELGTFPGDEESEAEAGEILGELGFSVTELTPELGSRLGYELDEGVVVSEVESGSIAEAAGIQQGHLILGVNRKPVTSPSGFKAEIAKAAEAKKLLLRIKSGSRSWYVLLDLR